MSGRSVVEFVEEWQTGFFVVIAVAVVGVIAGLIVRTVAGPPGFFAGFLGGVLVAFLAYSYLRYAR